MPPKYEPARQSNPDHHPAHDRLINDAEAAEYLDTTTSTLAVWRCTGRYDLPYVKVGRNVRYRLSIPSVHCRQNRPQDASRTSPVATWGTQDD